MNRRIVLASLLCWLPVAALGDDPKIIPAAEAKDHLDKACVVEMTVLSSKDGTARKEHYLDSEADFHDPKNAVALAEQNAINGRRLRPGPSRRLLDASLALTDRTAIQAALDAAIRLQLSGRISDARARTLLRYLRAAAFNFDSAAQGMPPNHELRIYFQRVEGLLVTIDPLLDELNERDAIRQEERANR